jgi:hypothetical protein
MMRGGIKMLFRSRTLTGDSIEFFEGSKEEHSSKTNSLTHKQSLCHRFKNYFFGRPPEEGTPPSYQETRYRYYPGKA